MILTALFYSIYGCSYLEDHLSCDLTTNQGLNVFTFNTQNFDNYEAFEVSIQTPQGYSIELEILDENLETQEISFYQPRIFETFGVYNVNVEVVLKDKISTVSREFSLLYDNSNPLPPVIESVTQLSVPGNPLKIEGFVNNPGIDSEVIIYNNGDEVDRVFVNDATFESTFNIEDVNRIGLETLRETGEVSSKHHFVHYSNEINFENANAARVNSVDFESINELITSTSSTIYSFSPYYHISGRASNGEMVFVQGVPIPVIDGNFESFILLNEGEEEVCVRGTNSICESITTIYSYQSQEFNMDLSNIDSFDTNSLRSEEFIEHMNAQGRFSSSYSQAELTSTPVNRNIFFLEFFYPGIYEKKYMLIDRDPPEIEILTSETLYPSSSTIGVYLNDDLGVDLESLRINIGNIEYTIDDAVNDESLGKVKYLEFPTPLINSNNEQIRVSVEDTSGNNAQKSKSASFRGRLDSNLKLETVNNRKIGNNVFISNNNPLQINVFSPVLNSQRNSPIAIKSLELDKQFVSSYSINDDNVITITIDQNLINQNSTLNLSVLIYESYSSDTFQQEDINLKLVKIEEYLSNNEEFRVVEKYVDNEITILELNNPYVDFSTLKVNGRLDNFFIKGNYLFVNTGYEEDAVVSYNDLTQNFKTFTIPKENLDINLNTDPSENSYITYTSNSNKNLYFVDLLSSKRTDELEVVLSNTQTHLNPSFLEGLSIQEQSFFSPKQETSKFDTLIQEQFSYTTYPSIEVDDIIEYRGLKKFTNEDSIVVQGRVLGSDVIRSVSIGEAGCTIKERFFVCRGIDTSDFYNVHVVSINGENLNESQGGNENAVIEVINPSKSESSILELNLDENENVFLSSEGYTFSSGDIVFDFTPTQEGSHELYINGELIKIFNIDDISTNEFKIDLLEEEYLNRDTLGSDLNVYVEDENNVESNSLSLRFTRILNAIISIVVS